MAPCKCPASELFSIPEHTQQVPVLLVDRQAGVSRSQGQAGALAVPSSVASGAQEQEQVSTGSAMVNAQTLKPDNR